MAKPDGRIEKGQRLASAISARAWNRAQDAADIVLGVRPGTEAPGYKVSPQPFTHIYAQFENRSEVSGRVWRVGCIDMVGASVLLNPPSANAGAWTDTPCLTNPLEGNNIVAVALEPIADGGIGRVAVTGLVAAKITINNPTSDYAIPYFDRYEDTGGVARLYPFRSGSGNEGGVAELETFPFAGYPILWHQHPANYTGSYPVSGVWALVDLSGYWAQGVVLAKTTTETGSDGGRVELFIGKGEDGTGIYVAATSSIGTVDSGKWVWVLNPYARSRFPYGTMTTLRQARYSSTWAIVAVDEYVNLPLMRADGTSVDVPVWPGKGY